MPSIRDQRCEKKKKIADGMNGLVAIDRCHPLDDRAGTLDHGDDSDDEVVPLQIEDVYQRQLEAVRLSQISSDRMNEELQEGVKPMVRLDIAELDDALALP